MRKMRAQRTSSRRSARAPVAGQSVRLGDTATATAGRHLRVIARPVNESLLSPQKVGGTFSGPKIYILMAVSCDRPHAARTDGSRTTPHAARPTGDGDAFRRRGGARSLAETWLQRREERGPSQAP